MVGGVMLVVYALAVCRLTGLITADEITRPLREAILIRLGADKGRHPHLAYLAQCPWCSSIYLGVVAAPLIYWYGTSPWLLVPALALALSATAGMTASLGRR